MKSATAISLLVVSAKAAPTDLSFAEVDGTSMGAVANLIAIIMGAEMKSELAKRRSSTACKFPGDAYKLGD